MVAIIEFSPTCGTGAEVLERLPGVIAMSMKLLPVLPLVAVVMFLGHATAKAPPPQEASVKVEVAVAAEHVSKDLKAGAKVDLERVKAKIGSGATAEYQIVTVFRDLEVVGVTRPEKPSETGTVKVELKVSGDQAKRIDSLKTEVGPYEERVSGKPATVVQKPAVLRLEEMTKVEVSLAAENVPTDAKPGASVRVVYVSSRTLTPTGAAIERRSPVVPGSFEVLVVDKVEKPTDPGQAVKVELRVSKTQAERIEKFKVREVSVVERAGGQAVRKKRTIPMVLELAEEAKEKK
jgi:hypothetical protein